MGLKCCVREVRPLTICILFTCLVVVETTYSFSSYIPCVKNAFDYLDRNKDSYIELGEFRQDLECSSVSDFISLDKFQLEIRRGHFHTCGISADVIYDYFSRKTASVTVEHVFNIYDTPTGKTENGKQNGDGRIDYNEFRTKHYDILLTWMMNRMKGMK